MSTGYGLCLLFCYACLSARSYKFRRASSKAICKLSRLLCAKFSVSSVFSTLEIPRNISTTCRGCSPNVDKNGVSFIVALKLVLFANCTMVERLPRSFDPSPCAWLACRAWWNALIRTPICPEAGTVSFGSFCTRLFFVTGIQLSSRTPLHYRNAESLVGRRCLIFSRLWPSLLFWQLYRVQSVASKIVLDDP